MFTGLVAELGTVQNLARQGESYHLTVAAKKVMNNLKIGDSVAVNGACLTVVEMTEGSFTADVMPETNVHQLQVGLHHTTGFGHMTRKPLNTLCIICHISPKLLFYLKVKI